jgi:hypothetical protein
MPDHVRQRVLDAVADGGLPAGGPSHLAALNLLDDVPPGYWERWGAACAQRIRDRAEKPVCTCGRFSEPSGPDRRCQRCMGLAR